MRGNAIDKCFGETLKEIFFGEFEVGLSDHVSVIWLVGKKDRFV